MKLSWEQLQSLLNVVEEAYQTGKIDLSTYLAEWEGQLEFAGWTDEEFADEVERRWTTGRDRVVELAKC